MNGEASSPSRFDQRSTDAGNAEPGDAGVCRTARLDRWGSSVADLLATLQELEHLGGGFVSLTEALDLTTPAWRAMAGLLAIFAEFEREILRERTRAGLAHARKNGKRLALRRGGLTPGFRRGTMVSGKANKKRN